ncbi:hypothetical protein H5410_023480 [Solanum commersonii]|uniref:Uncharacterized protein n=1 Tax=Solanum commersonii TaxID=4109 RepID=A0A9J5ZJ31_SOLCO|nr:hypothetical protein H5410_023480 [Solanum commersonii]
MQFAVLPSSSSVRRSSKLDSIQRSDAVVPKITAIYIYDVLVDLEYGDKIANIDTDTCEDLRMETAADLDSKTNQEKDLTAAAEKLAECQEIIFLLGKQLYSLRPQTKFMGSSSIDRSSKGEGFREESTTTTSINIHDNDS